MSADIRIGFSMYPLWLEEEDLSTFVAPLRSAGLSAFEFELDRNLALWPEINPMMEAAVGMGLDLSFHAPYRAPYSLIGFSSRRRDQVIQDYSPTLAIAEEWGRRLGSSHMVVIHAAASRLPADRESLEKDTLAFLRWGLDNYPHIRFALENNSPARENEIEIGEQLADVLAMIEALNGERERLKACWDMGHDYLRRGNAEPPAEWLSAVAHVHVHDVNEHGVDHYPLVFQRVPYQNWIQALVHAQMEGMIVLELDGRQMKSWPRKNVLSALFQSISSIAQEVLSG
ncbi:MAG TPA: TIM barrel protein [Anaerolineaceae bacterium]|nr:TIM barrel protein [Anaerolineaceae bacterium]